MNDLRANPAPLGLRGFGMTTVLLNIANAGVFGAGLIGRLSPLRAQLQTDPRRWGKHP